MRLHSSALEDGVIRTRYTQAANNHSLPLEFSDVPADAKALVVIMEETSSKNAVTHFLAYNIDASMAGFAENEIPEGVRLGQNDVGGRAYSGPKSGLVDHHYLIRLYALDSRLPLPAGAIREEVDRAMTGHVLLEAELSFRTLGTAPVAEPVREVMEFAAVPALA